MIMAASFPLELGSAPRKVQKKWASEVWPRLVREPTEDAPPTIKRLKGWKGFFRYRVGDHRIVYRVDRDSKTVTMLMVGHRASIYGRLGHSPEGGPMARIVADQSMDNLLDEPPSALDRGEALVKNASETSVPSPATVSDRQLPLTITDDMLDAWIVPPQFHRAVLAVHTEGDLLGLTSGGVPDEVIERIMNGLWPASIENIANQASRKIIIPEEVNEAARGEKPLDEFLLDLDDDQKKFVNRFKVPNPTGPWMVKGGPGSGKSTVALYCIKALRDAEQDMFRTTRVPIRILFTTYTKSLVAASKQLLSSLGVEVDVINVDALAYRYIPTHLKHHDAFNIRRLKREGDMLAAALSRCTAVDRDYGFSIADADFLIDEIEWVIIGEGLESLDEYQNADRSGRGRGLGPKQRRQLWQFHQELQQELRKHERCLWTERIKVALRDAKRSYDFVFIDEAQDLKPTAIRFCLALAKEPSQAFVTADPNQTIYGANMPWKRISSDLNFRGRTRIFRRNYRTTHETWEAIRPILDGLETTDRDTLDDEPVFHGELPTIGHYCGAEDEVGMLGEWLERSLIEERVSTGCGAVLCPRNSDCDRIAGKLPKRLNARAFQTGNLDISHRGVKIMTMHAAKGLQFPVVAVTGLIDGVMPWRAGGGMDEAENEWKLRRLFFVACSRAMRRLLVLGDQHRPSPFISGLDLDLWDEWESGSSGNTLGVEGEIPF